MIRFTRESHLDDIGVVLFHGYGGQTRRLDNDRALIKEERDVLVHHAKNDFQNVLDRIQKKKRILILQSFYRSRISLARFCPALSAGTLANEAGRILLYR